MIGQTVSHYKILEKLGSGGMGVVYKAEDTKLHRTVALKFLPPELTRDEEAKHRFIHEAQAASSLQHNNVCNIHDIDETADGQIFICMDYYEGETLKEKISGGPLKIDDAINITIQISEGLQKAHEKGIIHRDIKPANIYITDEGVVKILDFGLAKLAGQSVITKVGSTVGTVAYMSPEQTRGAEVDNRTDIWSLGVVVYEMLTGLSPFKGEYEQAILYSIISEEPSPITSLRTGVPLELERIVIKTMAKKPAERYQHIDELIVDLKRIAKVTESGISIKHLSGLPVQKRKVKNAIIPAVLIIILLIVFLLLRPLLFEEIVVASPKPIAVIAFTNQTGDSSYNYLREAIPNLLITSLEQSKYLRVMTWERMHDVLRQMGKISVSEISKDLGFELCQHEGVNTIVIGSYIKAGNTFVTDVKVLNVGTKEILKSASARGDGVQSILDTQIDQLSKEIASGVGLSQRKIESSTAQIIEVTTSSMEAYNFFLRGREEYEKIYNEEALRFLDNAIALDSNFAVAYFYLAKIYSGLLDEPKMIQAIEKAKVLSLRAPEKERLEIESLYALTIEKNPSKNIMLLKELVRKYPQEKRFHDQLGQALQREKIIQEAQIEFEKAIQLDPNYASPINGLAYIYSAQGLYDKAIETQQRYAALSPGDANPFDSMGEIYLIMGNLRESIAKYREALRVQPSFLPSYPSLSYVYALKEDYPECFQCLDSFFVAAPSIGLKAWVQGWKSTFLNLVGRYRESSRETEIIASLVNQTNYSAMPALYHWIKGWNALNYNNVNTARQEFEAFHKFYSRDNPQSPVFNKMIRSYHLSYIFLQEGLIDSARSYFENVKSDLNAIESFKDIFVMLSGILESELLLEEGRPDDAIHIYRKTPVVGLSLEYGWGIRFYNYPLLRDIVPRAFQKKGELDSTIIDYERLLRINPSNKDRRFINPIYHYRLAKICEQKRKVEQAEAEYKKFLELWKDADKDIPILMDAKKRFDNIKKIKLSNKNEKFPR
jgi:serine/threonine protein kinase